MADNVKAQHWWAASRTLGFSLWADSTRNEPTGNFDLTLASLRSPKELSEHDWMRGTHDGKDALVSYLFRDGGSSSDTHETHVLVRIDPPLFLGLDIAPRHFFSGAPPIGLPRFDRLLTLQSLAPQRGRALVWLESTELEDFLAAPSLTHLKTRVVDSYVQITASELVTDPRALTRMLGHASRIEGALARRRAQLPTTPEEARATAAWAHLAEEHRLQFDPVRRTLAGRYDGNDAWVAHRSSPGREWMDVRIALPIDEGLSLTVKRESSLSRLGNFLGFGDLKAGDKAFDDEHRVTGEPAPRIVALLERAAVRDSIARLVQRFELVRVANRLVHIAARPTADAQELAGVLSDVSNVVKSIAGAPAPKAGPYRA